MNNKNQTYNSFKWHKYRMGYVLRKKYPLYGRPVYLDSQGREIDGNLDSQGREIG